MEEATETSLTPTVNECGLSTLSDSHDALFRPNVIENLGFLKSSNGDGEPRSLYPDKKKPNQGYSPMQT